MALHETAFESLPLGSVKPAGWLLDQLRIQAEGLTGHLEEHWPDVGPDNGWLGGQGESWERGPYYVDGLVPLAYLLEDEGLIAKAQRWIEWTLGSQCEDGFFGPKMIATVNNDVDKRQDWWHLTIMIKALLQYAEATGDERVEPFLARFFGYMGKVIDEQPLRGWAEARGADLMLGIHWLHRRRPDPALIVLAQKVAEQTTDWTSIFRNFPFWRKVESWDWRTHVVNVAMGLKTPAVLYELTGDPALREAVERGIDSLMTYHGQAHGMFSGDEWLSGTHPSQGVELCAVAEYMFTLEQLARVFGGGRYGDILEKVAFNALPAAIAADWGSHQYDQQVNQVVCNVAPRPWSNGPEANLFGLEPNFGCCTANMHQGWPKLAAHLWMSDGRGGLAAVSYAPCRVTARVGDGAALRMEVGGGYPFREEVRIGLALDRPAAFALSLRIPGWCAEPVVKVNGEPVEWESGADWEAKKAVKLRSAARAESKLGAAARDGYVRIDRTWRDGDMVSILLPMEVRTASRHLNAVSVERGPLVYALPIRELWQPLTARERFNDWEVYPGGPWKYGLVEGTSFTVEEREPIPRQPFEAASSPVRVTASGQLVRNWTLENNSAGTPPLVPDTGDQPVRSLELVPYGGAKLRIAEFPLIATRRHRV